MTNFGCIDLRKGKTVKRGGKKRKSQARKGKKSKVKERNTGT